MALYVNINAGVGKPLWEITLGEFVVWFKVRGFINALNSAQLIWTRELLAPLSSIPSCQPASVYRFSCSTSGFLAKP